MNRAEHLQWCKDRALEYLKVGDTQNALASMLSDLNKHDETRGHIGIELAAIEMLGGMLNCPTKTERFINGFN